MIRAILVFALFVFSIPIVDALTTTQTIVLNSKRTAVASSPIAFIAGVTTVSTNGTSVTSGTIDSTGANFLVVTVSDSAGGALGSVTDNKGNDWAALGSPLTAYSTASTRVRLFFSKPTTVGSGHTVSYTGTQPAVGFAAFSNVNADPFDSEVGANGTDGSPTAGSITPSADGALIIAGLSPLNFTPATVDSGFTLVDTSRVTDGNTIGVAMSYFIQTSAATVNPVWTIDSGFLWSATNAVFKN